MSAVLQRLGQEKDGICPGVPEVSIRPLGEMDLCKADQIFRFAFSTFIGLPDPNSFMMGRDFIRSRWRSNPSGALGAEFNGELVGSNLASNWGSVGFFGPLTVRPDLWDHGVGKRLLEPTMELLRSRGTRHVGLFTFAQSPKHVGLYQKFGFFPRFLTAVMSRPVASVPSVGDVARYSRLSPNARAEALKSCRELTELLFPGMNLEVEIRAVEQHQLGDTVLLENGSGLTALAVCHFGVGSEGGRECCYVKFAAARPGPNANRYFQALLNGCEALASAEGLPAIEAGVNLACENAYRYLLARGFRTAIQGVAMHNPNEPAYLGPESYVIGDWR